MNKIKLLLFSVFCYMQAVSQDAAFHVLDYVPAPGQHINITNLGTPAAALNITAKVSASVSLGSFGGYIVLGFTQPCVNHPDNPYGIDFTVFGNAFGGSSEPGVVWVMKDENKNGLPDDTWYEIAGSSHFHPATVRNYQVTYSPSGTRDVKWKDNKGQSGILPANSFNLQEYYPAAEFFPQYPRDSVTFSGTLLQHVIDDAVAGEIKLPPPVFGYADSYPLKQGISLFLPDNPYTKEIEGAGGDPVDISWAVDEHGDYVNLDTVHFVKIVSASLASVGWLGEISTDVAWIEPTRPNKLIKGKENLLVVYPYPVKILKGSSIQLYTKYFEQGRKQDKNMQYEVQGEETVSVSTSGRVTGLQAGTAQVKISAGNETALVPLHVVVPGSITFLSTFTSVYPGDTIQLSAKVLDNTNNHIECPVVYHSSNTQTGKIIEKEGIYYFVALRSGETILSATVEGFQTETQVRVNVMSPDDKIRVLLSVKKEDENLLPLQMVEVAAANINSLVENRRSDYSSIEKPTLAHAVAAGLQRAGAGFHFRDDEAAGGELYLYKIEDNGMFTYGWGGKTQPAGYARGWIALLNSTHYINGFDKIEVSSGDTVFLYHVSNLSNDWIFTRLLPEKFTAEQGESIGVWLQKAACNFSGANITTAGFLPVAGAEVQAGNRYITDADGFTSVTASGSFPMIITSGIDAALIGEDIASGIAPVKNQLLQVYPNPAQNELYISVSGMSANGFPQSGFISGPNHSKVMIYNLKGKILMNKEIAEFPARIDLTPIPKGFYQLVVITGGQWETHKFVRQ